MDLLSILSCPVCLDTFRAPIMECEMGHSYCFHCSIRISVCPVCRGPKSTTRNLTVEKIVFKIDMPCNNNGNGCEYVGPGSTIHLHEAICTFATRTCPLKVSCQWKGTWLEAPEHFRLEHGAHLPQGPQQRISYDFGAEDAHYVPGTCGRFILMGPDDIIYLSVWDLEEMSMGIRWGVFALEGPEATNSIFHLDFVNINQPAQQIHTNGKCVRLQTNLDLNECYHIDKEINYNSLQHFCYDNDLYFCATIK